jgi:hypothetical protein
MATFFTLNLLGKSKVKIQNSKIELKTPRAVAPLLTFDF